MKKRILSLLLTTAMLVTMLAGCGAAEEKQLETPAATEDAATEETAPAETEEPVELRIFYSYDPAKETETSKFLVAEMEKALNIKIVRDEIPSSAYKEKLQLAMADGDYPDVFIFDDVDDPVLISAVDNGLIIPMQDYVKDMENIQKYTHAEAFDTAKIKNDENMYLIPRTTISRIDGYGVRQDWMEKLGFELSDNYTVTPDEFLTMIEAFMNDDPDGNGVDDTYGFRYPVSNGMMDVTFPGAFDCLGWAESDGEFAYMDPQYEIGNENYRKALEFSQEVYKRSHPDSAMNPEIAEGTMGVFSVFAGHLANSQNNLSKVVPDGKYTYMSGISNSKGEMRGVTALPGIWGGLAVTTACEHPEKVAEMVNWLLSDQAWEYAIYGQPGYTYEKNADGSIELNTEAYKENKKTGSNWSTSIARRKQATEFFLDLSLPEEEIAQVKDWIDTAVEGTVMPITSGKKPEAATDTMFIEAENKLKEIRTKIIMGVEDISAYDKALEDWYENGGRTYVEQMNELIATMQ